MQFYVDRAKLTGAADEIVPVLASFDEGVEADASTLGSNITLLFMPPNAAQRPSATPPADPTMPAMPPVQLYTLVPTWRVEYQTEVLAGEANRRIVTAFPEYSQRNSNAEINNYITTYGTSVASWPTAAQNRKAEIDRCWTYVNDVRAKANAMATAPLPADPTADGQWPPIISPYVPL